jgi:hypothetical protein
MVKTSRKPALALTRRSAIAGLGAAGVGLAIAGHLTVSRPLTGGGLYKIVYDDRLVEGRVFGARFASAGFSTATAGDNLTWLWFDDLDHRWRRTEVAGLTTPAVTLSLKLMAELAGLRAVIWGRPRIGPSSRASHVIAATEPALAAWQRQTDAGTAWTGALHEMILAAAAQPAASARFIHASGAPEVGASEMVSGLLAPVSKGSV